MQGAGARVAGYRRHPGGTERKPTVERKACILSGAGSASSAVRIDRFLAQSPAPARLQVSSAVATTAHGLGP